MKKRLFITTVIIWIVLLTVVFAEYYSTVKNIVADYGETINISARVITTDENEYISIDDVLKGSGYQLGWEPYHSAVIVYNPVLKENMYVYLYENKIWNGVEFINYDRDQILISNGCAYITPKVLADLTHQSFTYNMNPVLEVADRDKYRRNGNVETFNGIHILNGYYAFEQINITDEMAKDYADAVNKIAATLPAEVNVYNMAIPNSAEYYAPKEYSGDLYNAYNTIYESLDERVVPVNVYNILYEHADDYIFFNGDHHWTQRGAYYAFKEFMNVKGVELPYEYIDVYGRINSENVVGSFASLLKDTPGEKMISGNAELLERFYPPYTIEKNVYNDCRLEKFAGTGPLINKYINAYSTFIGGDVPVAQLHNNYINDGSTLCIIKDSYANAFAVWAACNYEYVYLVDIRCFNGANGIEEKMDMATFQQVTDFDDLLIMSYPNTIADFVLRDYIRKFAG